MSYLIFIGLNKLKRIGEVLRDKSSKNNIDKVDGLSHVILSRLCLLCHQQHIIEQEQSTKVLALVWLLINILDL